MKIVIIGGVAAGAKAAAKIKRLRPEASVRVFTDDTNVSYSSCGLPYYIQGNFEDYRMLLVRSVEEFYQSGIRVYTQSRVEQIVPERRRIIVNVHGKMTPVQYDKLIIATGARPKIPDISGIDKFKNIFTLRRVEDGINIRNAMKEIKNVTIMGSGYIGMELLEAFVKNDLNVTVLEKNSHIMKVFDPEMSDLIKQKIEHSGRNNFEIILNDKAQEIQGNNEGYVSKIITQNGREIPTDMIIICTGVVPNSELARDAGIEIGTTGAIKVNKLMGTSIENIYACGDCAQKTHIVSGRDVWIPLGSTANKEGRCAAMNAGGVYCEFEGVLGSTVSRCLNVTMSMTGLTEIQAQEIGFSPVSVTIEKTDKVAYMPEVGDITLKIIADKVTGLLLGGQAVGSIGADKRIYSLTSALLAHLTVQEFSNNDLTYSPPYSPTIDPLLDAMQILCKKVSKAC